MSQLNNKSSITGQYLDVIKKICPVGAVRKDGEFGFMACYTHNYRERLGGFQNWVEQIVASEDQGDFTFTGAEDHLATVIIRDKKLTVEAGHLGKPDLHLTAGPGRDFWQKKPVFYRPCLRVSSN